MAGGGLGNSIKFDTETRQLVRDMASQGKEIFSIAKEIGCTKRMLMYRCRKEIDEGREIAVMNGVPLPKWTNVVTSREEVLEETRYQIEMMAAFGMPVDQIAVVVGMAKMTLMAYCQEDIDRGRALGHQAVAGKLYDMAIDGEHLSATQFYLKAKCGWKETTSVEFPDENGNPQKITNDHYNVNLSTDKIQAIVTILNEKV